MINFKIRIISMILAGVMVLEGAAYGVDLSDIKRLRVPFSDKVRVKKGLKSVVGTQRGNNIQDIVELAAKNNAKAVGRLLEIFCDEGESMQRREFAVDALLGMYAKNSTRMERILSKMENADNYKYELISYKSFVERAMAVAVKVGDYAVAKDKKPTMAAITIGFYHGDLRVRLAAAREAGERPDAREAGERPDAVDRHIRHIIKRLLELLGDEHSGVRNASETALFKILKANLSAINTLKKVVSSEDFREEMYSFGSLKFMVDFLLKISLVQELDLELQNKLQGLLGQMNDPQVLDVLLEKLFTTDSDTERMIIIKAIGTMEEIYPERHASDI